MPGPPPGEREPDIPMRRRLAVRLSMYVTLALVLIGACILVADAFLVSGRELGSLRKRSELLAHNLLEHLGTGMVATHSESVGELLTFVKEQESVLSAYIMDPAGKVTFSSETDAIGVTLHGSAAGCVECHATSEPPAVDWVLLDDHAGRRFRHSLSIPNAAACHDCHAPSARSLGKLLLDLPTAQLDAELRDHRKLAAAIVGTTLLVAIAAIVLLLRWYVRRPLSSFLLAASRVEAGDLQARVETVADDELGRVARAFNRMVERLEHHTSNLEQTVAERTAELGALDRSLREVQAELLHTNRLATMGEMAAAVAHEIRTPLNALGLHLHLLRRRLTDHGPDATAELDLTANEIRRIDGVIERFLAMARFPPPKVAALDLNRLVETVLAVMEPSARRAGVRLETELASPAPVVQYDEDRLRHVLFNLVLNGIQALEGAGTLRVSTAAAQPQIVVADDGPGIPAELRARIFEPFFSTKEAGTGLGLAIAKRMLRESGGVLRLLEPAGAPEPVLEGALADETGATLAGLAGRERPGARFAIDLPVEATPAGVPPEESTT